MPQADTSPGLLLDVFGSVTGRSRVPDRAIRLLLIATKTGKRADLVEATEAIERVLRDRRLL
jgi:hypothetical protein